MEYFAIDFETANDYQNSACSVGVVRFVDIHGISYGDVRNKPQFPKGLEGIMQSQAHFFS